MTGKRVIGKVAVAATSTTRPGEATQPESAASNDGTQAIRRAAGLLRAIVKASPGGDSLSGLARGQGLARSTVHRILHCLEDEGLLERVPAGGPYRMGPLIHELSLAPTSSTADVARWGHVVEAVARRCGVTSYLMRRSGIEAVCLVKVDGASIMRFVPVDVGQRRLLGVGAGATALLAALPPAQAAEVIRAVAPGLARYPRLDPEALSASVALARQSGYSISQGTVVVDGFGMGRAIDESGDPPRLAMSIAAHASIVTESRIAAWKQVLSEEIAKGLRSEAPPAECGPE